MTDNERLAEALGYEQTSTGNAYERQKDRIFPWSDLMSFIASPAGEKAVRDKVRELCNADKKIKRITSTHSTCNWKEIPDTHTIELLGVSCYVQADTEPEAYAAALIWLAERGD